MKIKTSIYTHEIDLPEEKKYVLILVKLLILLMLLDFSGDYLIYQAINGGIFKDIEDLIRKGIVSLLAFISLIGMARLSSLQRLGTIGRVCLSIILTIFLYGLIHGLITNNPTSSLREMVAVGSIFLIPLIIGINKKHIYNIAKYLIYLMVIVIGFKIVISQLLCLEVYGTLAFKVILRLSKFLLLPYSYFLVKAFTKEGKKIDLIFLLVVIIEILISQSRGLNLAVLLVTFFVFFISKNKGRVVLLLLIISFAALAVMFFTGNEVKVLFGMWSGSNFENTVEIRSQQFDMLIDRFYHRPLTGYGFGYVTPGSEYEDMELSYSLELDLINFFSKIGIPFSLLYIFSYALFVRQYIRAHFFNNKNKVITLSYLVALLSLLFFSLTQTAHSSYVYWIVYAITFLLLFKRESVNSKNI